MGRWEVTAGVALLSAMTIAGCASGSQPRTQVPSTSSTPSATASPTVSIDPNAQPAVDAYRSFNAAATAATRDPEKFMAGKDPTMDFQRYSFDPFRGQYISYVMSLARQEVAFRGAPPQPRLSVLSADLTAKPYPKVVLSNCETPAPSWREYVVKTGKVVPEANQVPPPYRTTIEIIYYDKHWGVSKVTVDRTKTCTA